MDDNTKMVAGIIIISALIVVGASFFFNPQPKTADTTTNTLTENPGPLSPEQLAAYNVDMTNKTNPIAKFTTNLGTFEVELFADTMPITTENFIKLTEENFYDGIKFHRVIPNFMIQGGDPITKTDEIMRYGTGGPGYSIPDEHIAGKYLTNARGTISMANSGPNSGGSQFFINVVDNTFLDFNNPSTPSQHPVFGRVLSGMDVVDKISVLETNPSNNLPLEDVVMEKVEIIYPE